MTRQPAFGGAAEAERLSRIHAPRVQRACDRCTQGVMDRTNDHLRGRCACPCHRGD